MRSAFDEQLNNLNKELTRMGAFCEEAIELATKALVDGDTDLVPAVRALATSTDQMQKDIEALCLKLLIRQQPVAKDLRLISAALKMVTDLERIGDQAEDIAETVVHIDKRHQTTEHADIEKMAKATIKMLKGSIDAFVDRDIELAEETVKYDDVVDEDFINIKNLLIDMISEDASSGSYALDLLMIAKYFERIGDHAVNVAMWVIESFGDVRHREGGEK